MVKKGKLSARRIARREETKQKIKKAAYKLFARKGFQHTTVEDIASEVGLVKSAVLYYFPHKEDILEAVIEDRVKAFFNTLTQQSLKSLPLNHAAVVIFDRSCQFLFEEPDFFRLFLPIQFSSSPRGALEKIRKFMEKNYRPMWEEVLPVERRSREAVLFTVWSFFLGVCHAYLSGRPASEVKQLIQEARGVIEKIFA